MKCSKIVLLDSLCELDDFRDSDGALSITVPNDTSVTINKKTEELSDLDKLVSDYSNTFELLLSTREITILSNIQYDKVSSNRLVYRAYFLSNGIVQIDGFLFIDGLDERIYDGIVKVKCQLIGTHQQWKDYFRTNKLDNLELGSVTWNNADIVNLWQNNGAGYVDGSDTIYPLLANFGKRLGTNGACSFEVRFAVYAKALIDAAFCQAGYKIRSQIINSIDFRRQALYLLETNFGLNENISKGTFVEVESSANSAVGGSPVPLDTIIQDDTGKFDTINYWYVNNTGKRIYDLFIDLDMTQENTSALVGASSAITIRVEDGGGSPIFPFPSFYFPPAFDRTASPANPPLQPSPGPSLAASEIFQASATIDLGQILRDSLVNTGFIEPGWRVRIVHINAINPFVRVNAGAFARFYTKNPNWFEVGDVIPIGQVLNKTFSIYDLMQDLKKAFNLRFRTIESQKIVEIEPEPATYKTYDNFQFPGVVVEGFSGNPNNPDDVDDITDFIDVCQFISKTFPDQKRPVYYDFKFKDSTDNYNRYKDFGDANLQLWQNDTSENIPNVEKRTIDLKIIEPTLNDYDKEISNAPFIAGTYIPYMWENAQAEGSTDLPEMGSNIAPRLLFVYGWLTQVSGTDAIGFEYEGVTYQFVPNVGQLFEAEVVFSGGGGIARPPQNNVFRDNLSEDEQTKNHVNTYYEATINNELRLVEVKLKAKFTDLFFKCLNVRKIFRIFSEKNSLMKYNGYYTLVSVSKNVTSGELSSLVLKPKIPCDG